MSTILIFIIALTLSMDAFSLALIYGTLNLPYKMHKLMSIMVGIFHFFMPILGYQVGELILKMLRVDPDILVGIIFIILGMEMLISLKHEEKVKLLTNFFSVILFALTVSIDSFSVGISFGVTNTNILFSCMVFALVSGIFTFIGVKLGKKLSDKFGKISTLIGAIILLILGIKYLT